MITETQKQALIDAMRKVGREVVMPRFSRLEMGEVEAKSNPADLVTVADKASELALTAMVKDILPDAVVVGEESVAEDAAILDQVGTADQVVVIDPIDGTWAYAHGIGSFGIILSVVEKGETIFGVIHDPVAERWIYASKDGGAWRDLEGGQKTRLILQPGPEKAAEAMGFLVQRFFPKDVQRNLALAACEIDTVRSIGASAQEYRLLAEDHADFSQNAGLNAWDHAAGVLIYQEAGGIARLLDGRDYAPAMTEGRLLLARNEALWREVAQLFGDAIGEPAKLE